MKKLIMVILTLLISVNAYAITGFYKTIDDETGKPKSIVAVYENNSKVYGRIILIYDEDGKVKDTINEKKLVADKFKGDPSMCGLDIIYDMKKDGNEYKGGKITDPKKGKTYTCVMWSEPNRDLNVRGKIGPFGRTQKWIWIEKKDLPKEISKITFDKFTPSIISTK